MESNDLTTKYRFCPRCGNELVTRKIADRERPACGECDFVRYQNPVAAVAVIIMQDRKILLARRKGSHQDKWFIPCGHIEWDEDIRDAAVREMQEETGLEVELGEVFSVHSNFHNPNLHSVGIWFLGRIVGGKITPGDDVDKVEFFPLNNIPENLAFETDQKVLEELLGQS